MLRHRFDDHRTEKDEKLVVKRGRKRTNDVDPGTKIDLADVEKGEGRSSGTTNTESGHDGEDDISVKLRSGETVADEIVTIRSIMTADMNEESIGDNGRNTTEEHIEGGKERTLEAVRLEHESEDVDTDATSERIVVLKQIVHGHGLEFSLVLAKTEEADDDDGRNDEGMIKEAGIGAMVGASGADE